MTRHSIRTNLVLAMCFNLGGLSFVLADDENGKGAGSVPTAATTRYADIVRQLKSADVPLREQGSTGKIAVTLAGGRVVAMAFSEQGENLFWTHPQLRDRDLVKKHPEKLIGGIGGERLWFAPELNYGWDGPPNWKTFANYTVPASADPGAYRFVDAAADTIELKSDIKLKNLADDHVLAFRVTRQIKLAEPPLARDNILMKGVDYVGIETRHHLVLDASAKKGVVDLWHILQVPAGAVLILPLRKGATAKETKPLSYALAGGWVEKKDHVMWKYGGKARAKFGLSAGAVTGRCAAIRKLDNGKWCLLVRQFPYDAKAKYCDHPYGSKRDDQVFQAWDGYGFGEVEFHSPAVDAASGPREIRDTDTLWAMAGSATAITRLAKKLLNVDISYVFDE